MSRNTHQREVILSVFKGKGIHLTPAEVMEKVREIDDRVSLATVYRNLIFLCEQGKIRKVSSEGVDYYDGNVEPHDHAVCVRCGRIIDVPSFDGVRMDAEAAQACGMKILGHSVLYEGLCADCANRDAEEWRKC